MKRIILTLAILMTMAICANAQSDGFFRSYCDNDYTNRTEDNYFILPNAHGTNSDYDSAPLGSGLLILTVLGAGYAISRRKRSHRDASNASKTALLALAILLITPSCKKKIAEPVNNTVQTNGVNITLNVDGGNSKVIVDPTNNGQNDMASVKFETGDIVYVGYNNAYVGSLSYTSTGDNTGYFSGSVNIASVVDEQPLHFYFLGGKGFTPDFDGNTATVNISDQTSKYPIISYNHSTRPYDGAGSYSAKLICKCSIMKFNVTTPSSAAICITGMNNKVSVNFATPTGSDNGFSYSVNSEDGGLIKMKGGSGSPATKWAIVLPQDELAAGSAGSIYANNGTYTTFTGSRPLIHAIESNKYYHESGDVIYMTVNTATDIVDLGDVTANKTITNGQTVTGTLGRNVEISIANGAAITLENATINTSGSYPGLTCQGSATINLIGTNTVNGGSQKAGILIGGTGTTLTINGPGSLSATGGSQSAGIGLSRNWGTSYTGGSIVINGGTITAKSSGVFTSGIGTGCVGTSSSVIMGDITINGGTVIAYGSEAGAGIGTGFCYNTCTNRVGNITITGGSVSVTGGVNNGLNPGGTAIGAGPSNYANSTNAVGNITISGGTVTATCGTYAVSTIGKSSANSVCGNITISGTHIVTLNNPNNSGFPVSLRTIMDTGNTIYLALTAWLSGSSLEYADPFMSEDTYYNVEFGCPTTAQQFVYRPLDISK